MLEIDGTLIGNEMKAIQQKWFDSFEDFIDHEDEIRYYDVGDGAALAEYLIYEVNHKLMGDFVSMSNDEINRFMKMEKLLESKISRRFGSADWIRTTSGISWNISMETQGLQAFFLH